jgi:hypothetical protein
MKPRGSRKATAFTESVIREMTRLAHQPDAVAPGEARRARRSGLNARLKPGATPG